MRLAAQRVSNRDLRRQAIHAFHYIHGNYVWAGRAPANLGPGILQASRVEIHPASGNPVQSYLDIVAPDETPTQEIDQCFEMLLHAQRDPPPWRPSPVIGRCTFDANLVNALRAAWRRELRELYRTARQVRITIL